MKIRTGTGDGDRNTPAVSPAKRVHLPFTQDLVKVGSGGEHPLLTAARLYCPDLSVKGAEEAETPTPEPRGLTPAPASPSKSASKRARPSSVPTVRFDPSELGPGAPAA